MRPRKRVHGTEKIAGPGLIPGVRAWLIPAASRVPAVTGKSFILRVHPQIHPLPSPKGQPPASY